jgi:hypothetical protein
MGNRTARQPSSWLLELALGCWTMFWDAGDGRGMLLQFLLLLLLLNFVSLLLLALFP